MSEFDELRRLREADPIQASSIPSAEDAGPRALRERIMMEESTSKSWLRSRTGAIAAAVAVVLVATLGVVLATRGTTPKPKPGGSVVLPGSAMCVEQYSLTTVKNRAVAFDGTVKSVSGDNITFTVSESFKGGSGHQITLKGASTLGGITSAGPGVSLDPGSHLPVAGDGGFAWSCGFTQPFDRQSPTIGARRCTSRIRNGRRALRERAGLTFAHGRKGKKPPAHSEITTEPGGGSTNVAA